MAGRFDPVRDSVVSPPERYRELAVDEMDHGSLADSAGENYEFSRDRRPSRSASIAGILNDDDQSMGSRQTWGTDGAAGSSSNGAGLNVGQSRHFASSPASSSARLPLSSVSPTSHSPRSSLVDLGSYHDGLPLSPSDGRPMPLHRHPSTHSTASSTEYHAHQTHEAEMPSYKLRRSPSVLHLLNSDVPRSLDEGEKPNTSVPGLTDLQPRSRGPSFAGGLSILSPTNEARPNGRAGSTFFHARHESVNQSSPLQRSVAHSPLSIDGQARPANVAGNQSYFAVPDVPFRSPDTMRARPAQPSLQQGPVVAQAESSTSGTVPPRPPRVAYKPSTRVSVPTSIRLPVTALQVDEMRFQCRNSLRTKWQEVEPSRSDGWEILVAHFAAQISQPDEGADGTDATSDRKRKRQEVEESNAHLVAEHYNSRQDQGLGARKQSPILPLRNFNNWIKSVIIGMYAKRQGRVLDLGGGKGGDLNKWDKGGINEYVLCDIASVSVRQAESRYNERTCRFQARFFSFDCFSAPLADNIPRAVLEPHFDNVSLQFCLHYGWESVPKAQLMLENIARYLKPGGVFVGTIPNADLLRSKLSTAMEQSPSTLTFGNQYYTVRFEPTSNVKSPRFPPFGHKYYFTLVDAVDDVAEYVVDWDQFISLAQQNGLECIFKKTFEQVWREEGQLDHFRTLTRKMRITPDGPNGIPMNEALWEATGLYLAFAFEKKSRP